MLNLMDSASLDEVAAANCDDVVRNRVVSPCGRFESYDCNGFHFDVDWDEIDPTDADLEEDGIPHDQVMRESREFIAQLRTQR